MTDRHAADLVDRLRRHNAGRELERLALKYQNMSEDPFVFLRGSARLFYERASEGGLLGGAPADGPRAWLSGDLHLENFGTFEAGEAIGGRTDGRIVFDVNDFDEAALAPCFFDILRLATSVLVAGKVIGLSAAQARETAHRLIVHYFAELAGGRPRVLDAGSARGPIRDLMQKLRTRDSKRFLDDRVRAIAGAFVLTAPTRKALPLDAATKSSIAGMLDQLQPPAEAPRAYAFIDAARRIAGTGSLGIARHVILTEGERLPGMPPAIDKLWLLDAKAARPSALCDFAGPQPEFASEAARVVTVQRMLQAAAPALLQTVAIGADAFVLRRLQPSDDKLKLSTVAKDRGELESVVDAMAHLAAWGHLRGAGQMGAAPAAGLRAAAEPAGVAEEIGKRATELAGIAKADFKIYKAAFDAGAFASQ